MKTHVKEPDSYILFAIIVVMHSLSIIREYMI